MSFVFVAQSEIRKYGVRPLPKKKMVAKLYEITDYVRQGKHKQTRKKAPCSQ